VSSAPSDQQAVAIDAEHATLDLVGTAGRQAVAGAEVAVDVRARVLRGWMRVELARAAHLAEKTLRDMLSGRRRPTFGTVQSVCAALGLMLPTLAVFADRED
jgi:DNA-binding phage protein